MKMNLSDEFLFKLSTLKDNRRIADDLHRALEDAGGDRVGALLLARDGSPLALVEARREPLQACKANIGALFAWASWTWGTEALVTWHTCFEKSSDPSSRDLAFVRHLVDLGGITGFPVLDHWVFGPRPDLLALRRWSGWTWPTADVKRITHQGSEKPRSSQRHWNPVTGDQWSGLGRHRPRWIEHARDLELEGEAFESPFSIPSGSVSFGAAGAFLWRRFGPRLQALQYRPPEGWHALSLTGEQVLGLGGPDLARGLFTHLDPPPGSSLWGTIFLDECGRVRRPTAGVWAARSLVAGRPAGLYLGSLELGYSGVITFSIGSFGKEPRQHDFQLARKVKFIGEILGFPVDDHYFIDSPDRQYSWKTTTRWAWPETKSLECVWP